MTTLDALTEPLVRLFLRIDAAHPTDELLRRISDFWIQQRAGRQAPGVDALQALPIDLRANSFLVKRAQNGTRHWLSYRTGKKARSILALKENQAIDFADKRSAVRLRKLFEIVEQKGEPYSAMFERSTGKKGRELVEVFAAPLVETTTADPAIFAAVNSRKENLK